MQMMLYTPIKSNMQIQSINCVFRHGLKHVHFQTLSVTVEASWWKSSLHARHLLDLSKIIAKITICLSWEFHLQGIFSKGLQSIHLDWRKNW